jgi:predicted Zn-dependent peptidase
MSVEFHTLPNGFRVVTERMEGLKSASLGIWVMAGARNERLEQNGIAHFLEHMAFKGTKRRSALEIAEKIEDVGGYINAYTSREMTAYYARVLEDDVPLGLDVIADIVLNSTYDPKEIEIERGVILQEIGQSNDTPDDVIFDWLQEASYPDQPLGRAILGPAERVRNFSRADFTGFVAEHYGPGQMILSAAGAIDHDALLAEAERLFGHLPARAMNAAPEGRFIGREYRQIKELEQAHFTLALEGPGYREDTIYTAQIYSMALGGGMSSRLFQQAREKRGLCYTISASAVAFSDTGMLSIYSGTSGQDIAALAHVCVDELRRAGEDMTEAEVARARTQLKAGLLMGLESPASRCERLARMVAIWDRVPTLEETVAHIDAVSLGKVSDYAQGVCTRGKASMALYGPVENAPTLEELTQALGA